MNQAVVVRAMPQIAHLSALPHAAMLPTFDLTAITARVGREHPDWSPERLSKAEDGYRLFMAHAKMSRDEENTPTRDVDEIWHAHILHTKEYVRDCTAYFGYFLHHVPLASEAKARCDGHHGLTTHFGGEAATSVSGHDDEAFHCLRNAEYPAKRIAGAAEMSSCGGSDGGKSCCSRGSCGPSNPYC